MRLHPERYALALLLLVLSLGARGEAVVVIEHWPPREIVDAAAGDVTGGRAVELTRALFARPDMDLTFRSMPGCGRSRPALRHLAAVAAGGARARDQSRAAVHEGQRQLPRHPG